MSKIRITWDSDKILSLSAMSISFITLAIFIYQTNLMRQQNYISIMPYLDISTTSNTAGHVFELNIKNHGVGPAIIESVTLVYKGKRHGLADYDNRLFTFLASLNSALDSLKYVSSSTLDKGMAIPANSVYNVFAVSGSPEDFHLMTESLDKLIEDGLDYEIIYKSIQGERWRLYHNSEGPERLD